MAENLTARITIAINASAEEVWAALTQPELVKQYMFGTLLTTDWKVGSPIRWTGEWQGTAYEDKGEVLAYEEHSLLTYTYLSSMSGKPDVVENYSTITARLSELDGVTTLSLEQDGNTTQEAKEHSEKNWQFALGEMKKLIESK